MSLGDIFGGLFGGGGDDQSDAATKAADTQAAAAKYAADLEKQMFEETRGDYKPWLNTGTSAINFLGDLNGLNPGSTSVPSATAPPASTVGTGTLPAGIAALLQKYGISGVNVPGMTGAANPATTAAHATTSPASKYTPQQQAMQKFFTDPGYQFSVDQGTQAIDRSAAAKGRLFSGATGKALEQFGVGTANQEYGDWYNRIANLAGVGQSAAGSVAAAGQNYATQAGNAEQNAANARASGYINSANAKSNSMSNLLNLAGTAASFFI